MAVSENAEKRWREFFSDPRNNTRRDALERAMRGTLPVDADPMKDPLFMPAEAATRRESIMRQVQTWEESAAPCGFDNPVIVDGDNVYRADEFFVWQTKPHTSCSHAEWISVVSLRSCIESLRGSKRFASYTTLLNASPERVSRAPSALPNDGNAAPKEQYGDLP